MQDVDLRGIIPAIVTPMTSNAELDLPALRRYAQWLADQGPVALAVNVDTGEGPHLTADEKRQTLETVAEAVAGKCLVVGGVAGPSTAQGVINARAAQAVGSYGIDISSGVEASPGQKDAEKVAALFEALRPACRRTA